MTRPKVERKRWHWIITLDWTDEGGVPQKSTLEGTCAPPPGATRQDMFGVLYRNASRTMNATNGMVLYFNLAPNDL
ncbi:MAG TPA: hypothetical protein VFF37_07235 [Streptomyces sp.]|nr:hypothetical protein [Streptomyces sp.]